MSQFEVTATITPSGATPIVAKAVIPVVNTYALNRNRGLLLPPVANQRNLSKSGSDWTGALSIKNSEPEQLSFSKREVELRPCNHESAPKYLSPETINLVVAASASLSVDFSIPQSQLSTDYCGLAVRYIGQSASGTKTVASAFFDANAPTFKPVTDATLGAALLKIVQQKLLPNTDEFSGEDVYRLAREGKLTIDTANATTYGPKDPARLDPGEQCHPGETPRKSSDGQPELVCTMVDNGNYQDMFEVSDAYLENAVRGDTLLSHFCGDVGAMLSALSPSQYYTHTGIMIGHYEYLRHATSVSDRYATETNLHLGSTGSWIEENVLKYGWPGSISETVQDAYVGNPQRSDPDGLYFPEFHAFESEITRCGDENSPIVAPRVLKPLPGTGDTGRAPLYAAADMVESDSLPQAHYRFFAYSDAAQAAQSRAAGSWADGTIGVMCASYIWSAFKAANIQLEGDSLEPGDRGELLLAGDTSAAPDGLYRYDPEERKAAAYAIYSRCYDSAYNKLGFFKKAWTNLAYDNIEDVCSQIVACFAKDNCGKGAGDEYLSVLGVEPETVTEEGMTLPTEADYAGTGTTVSPDDVMNWDVYPYNEQLVYRSSWIRRRYIWVAAAETGDIDVIVKNRDTGAVVENATMTLQSALKESDSNGVVHFKAIPYGPGVIIGDKMAPDGHFLRGLKEVTIGAQNDPVELLLTDDYRYRKLVVTLQGLIHEDEGSALYTEDEVHINAEQKVISLYPGHESDQWLFRPACCGGEVTGEADFFFNEDQSGGVTVTGNMRLWEGSSCKDVLRTTRTIDSFYVARDSEFVRVNQPLKWGPENNWDFFNLDSISVKNGQETFPNDPLP